MSTEQSNPQIADAGEDAQHASEQPVSLSDVCEGPPVSSAAVASFNTTDENDGTEEAASDDCLEATASALEDEQEIIGCTLNEVAMSWEKKRELTIERTLRGRVKSPILLAFNLYAGELREEFRKNVTIPGAEVEKIIGERWKNLPKEERDPLVEVAKFEQAKLLAQYPEGLPEEGEGDRPIKRRKKNVGKIGAQLEEGGIAAQEALGPIPAPVTESSNLGELVGKNFEGVVDGFFDIGYFLTVKVGSHVLKGLMFRGSQDAQGSANGDRADPPGSQTNAVSFSNQAAGGGQTAEQAPMFVPSTLGNFAQGAQLMPPVLHVPPDINMTGIPVGVPVTMSIGTPLAESKS